MATLRPWLNLPFGHNDNTRRVCIMPLGMFKYCPSINAKTSHVLLFVFCIAYSQSVPIFREVPYSSG